MIISILVFIFILGILVFAHELGHFLAAKQRGVRVEEFAFGFPPRLFGIRRGETLYSLNLIPVGGFVRLSGESPDGVTVKKDDAGARRGTAEEGGTTDDAGARRGTAEEGGTTDDAGARRGTAEEGGTTDDAGARRYDKPEKGLSGEPRAERAGEGTAEEGGTTDDAGVRRYDKPEKGLSGEPRAERAGEGTAEEGGTTDDAGVRRYDKPEKGLSGEPRAERAGEGTAEEGGTTDENTDDPRSFRSRPLWERVLIVAAGVAGNVILAWLLFSLAHVIGMPNVIEDNETGVGKVRVVVTSVAPGSPAQAAGIRPGDVISELRAPDRELRGIRMVEDVQRFVGAHRGMEIMLAVERSGKKDELRATPRTNAPEGEGALGIAMVRTGTRSYPWYVALFKGAATAWRSSVMIIQGIGKLLMALVTEGRLVADVAGPVGIAVLSHEAALLGISYLIFFAAILSLNLAVINSLPLPALDGGRLLFLAIEWVKGSPVSRKAEQAAHTAGFAFLILLLALVTYRDIARIF